MVSRRRLLAATGATVAVAGCLDSLDDEDESPESLELKDASESTSADGNPTIVTQFVRPSDAGELVVTATLYDDGDRTRRIIEYLTGEFPSGEVGHTVTFLNADFDEFEVDLARFRGSVPASGAIEVAETEFSRVENGEGNESGEMSVTFDAPADTDRVRVAVDLFVAGTDTPGRTVTEPVELDVDGGRRVSHAVSLRPPSVFDDYRVRVDPASE
jgi:hypothetical protein